MAIMSNSTSELLERLACLSHCSYLSDLRYLDCPCPPVVKALRAIPAMDYTCQCWQEALYYLTGHTMSALTDSPACRQYLIDRYSGQIKKKVSSLLDTYPRLVI